MLILYVRSGNRTSGSSCSPCNVVVSVARMHIFVDLVLDVLNRYAWESGERHYTLICFVIVSFGRSLLLGLCG